jgi:hypothetical protein
VANKALNAPGNMMSSRWLLKPYLQSGELQELFFTPRLRVSQSNVHQIFLGILSIALLGVCAKAKYKPYIAPSTGTQVV